MNGTNSYVTLPATHPLSSYNQITVSTWVYWKGGKDWQRIFDFGNGTTQYMFLTPKTGNFMRFAIKNGGAEQIVQTSQLAANTWVHVAVTLGNGTEKLYVNGVEQASANVTIKPSDFKPTLNYIGKSQFSDPLFSGMLDEFRIYDHVLSADEILQLANNTAPQGDNSLLAYLLDKAAALDAKLYTESSWQAVAAAARNAKALASNANQAAIDVSAAQLLSALDALEFDKTPPAEATLSADITDPTNQGVTVTISYPDDAAVKEYKVGESGTWTAYTAPVVVPDNDTVYARGTDAVGNVSNVTSMTVSNIYKIAPVTTATLNPAAPNGKNSWYTMDVTVSLSVYASVYGGAVTTEYQVNDGAWITYTGSIPAFGEGTYKLGYRSKDQAGNVEHLKTIEFKVDKTAPSLIRPVG